MLKAPSECFCTGDGFFVRLTIRVRQYNHSPKMYRFDPRAQDRVTDGQTDGSQYCLIPLP